MKDSKREKAICVAHSILTSLGFEPQADQTGDFVVEGKAIRVGGDLPSLLPSIVLNIEALASNQIQKIREEGNRLAAFLGKPPLVFRVESAAIRTPNEDYEGKALRLTQFKRTLNPPNSVLQKLKPIVDIEARNASRHYAIALREIGQDVDDLKSIGMIFAINYWWQYAREKDGDEINAALFVFNLRQQFARWHEATRSKNRSIARSVIGLPIDEYSAAPAFSSNLKSSTAFNPKDGDFDTKPSQSMVLSYEIEIEELLDTKREIFKKVARKRTANAMFKAACEFGEPPKTKAAPAKLRKRSAGEDLNHRLSTMPHDEMIERLTEVVGSLFIDEAAKKLARKKLRDHKASCSKCPQEK